VPTRSGDATADLRALLEEKCPVVATEAMTSGALAAPPQAGNDDANGLRWRKLVLGQIPGLDLILSTASAPLSVIAAILSFIAGILDVISTLLLAIPDPIRALVLAAYNLLKQIIDDFLATGVYLYFDAPGLTSNIATLTDMGLEEPELPKWVAGDAMSKPSPAANGFEAWAHTFEQSFDDPGDTNRPIFSDSAPIEALFIVATAPQLVDLRPFLDLLHKLLDISAFELAVKNFKFPAPDPDRARLRLQSVAPDWRSLKLRDIAPPKYPLRKLEKIPEYLKTLLLNIDNIVELIKKLIAAIRDKVQVLRELIAIIESVIELIRALSATGLHVLPVVTPEGVKGLKKAFLEAKDRPNTDAAGNPQGASAIIGVCVLQGASGLGPNPQALWAMLGQGKSFEQAYSHVIKDFTDVKDTAVKSWDDAKAAATTAWQGAEGGGDRPTDKGLVGLWGDLKGKTKAEVDQIRAEARETARRLGMSDDEIEAGLAQDRNALMTKLQHAHGAPLSPQALAHIEATRRARGRGARSLALAAGHGGWATKPSS
jgi:hypothetical protein